MNLFNQPLNKIDVLSYWIVLFVMILFFSFAQCLKAQDNPSGNLVSAEWLEKNLANPNLLLLDASPEKSYNESHIQGAVNVNVYMFGVMETPLPMMEKLFQSVGISADKIIVIYDQGGSILAPRMFYSLYYHGFPKEKIFILDGGFAKWTEKSLPVTKDITKPALGNFSVKQRNEDARVMLDEFLTASGDTKNNALIEALEPEWHYGSSQFFDKGGHIPNVLSFPAGDFFNADKTFKSPGDIQKLLSYRGVNPSQKILTHCGGGVAAAVPFFALKFILGYDNVKLFMESQMGWLKDERNLPFWSYDMPNMMRESHWLNTWGGDMMRRYGFSTVSIIDVRDASVYNNEHLPFSVNITGDVFRQYAVNPKGLADVLGKNGVDINHEAVIFSGGGITKESALAFALLKSLGQNRVSLFTQTIDEYKSFGFKTETQSTETKPVNYSPAYTNDVFIGENTAKGIYDEVYIVSGAVNNPPKGKVINIDYTQFLNSVGKPKEAKEIWGIMKNAGVPRYARIVCYSNDAGESAVNYFIFTLMGFPDVKIKM